MDLFNLELPSATVFDFANMTPYELGRNVLLPFLLVFVVLWAVLEKLHIFNRKVNIVFSLGVCIILASTPAFTVLSQFVTQISGTGMIIIFAVVLIAGTLFWAFGRGRDIYYEQVAMDKKITSLEKKIKKARKKGNLGTAEELERQLRQARYKMRERYRR
jgi:low affinity Fe/Cu permease